MKKCGTSLTPNSAQIVTPRRSSAVELSSSSSVSGYANTNVGLSNNVATLGITSPYANLGGSRSAATSPVGVVSSNQSLPVVCGVGGAGGGSGKEGGSPRHSNRTSNEAWVCPNDRQLALRAK